MEQSSAPLADTITRLTMGAEGSISNEGPTTSNLPPVPLPTASELPPLPLEGPINNEAVRSDQRPPAAPSEYVLHDRADAQLASDEDNKRLGALNFKAVGGVSIGAITEGAPRTLRKFDAQQLGGPGAGPPAILLLPHQVPESDT